ncbi:uncharacterized protein VTP21DRAFT_11651 [Calcarisporiella thermophila]|uniref:uncharacterized protein n=1 Tax=Calcarisporiella thermophila TaxID=911321 RepID=UPI0037422D98
MLGLHRRRKNQPQFLRVKMAAQMKESEPLELRQYQNQNVYFETTTNLVFRKENVDIDDDEDDSNYIAFGVYIPGEGVAKLGKEEIQTGVSLHIEVWRDPNYPRYLTSIVRKMNSFYHYILLVFFLGIHSVFGCTFVGDGPNPCTEVCTYTKATTLPCTGPTPTGYAVHSTVGSSKKLKKRCSNPGGPYQQDNMCVYTDATTGICWMGTPSGYTLYKRPPRTMAL